jgi:hypothetical protein
MKLTLRSALISCALVLVIYGCINVNEFRVVTTSMLNNTLNDIHEVAIIITNISDCVTDNDVPVDESISR